MQEILNYFKGDALAASSWNNKYRHENESIEDFFNRVIYKSYSVGLPDDYFSNELLTNLNSNFDFINDLPEDYLFLYQEYQKEIFKKYYENLSENT